MTSGLVHHRVRPCASAIPMARVPDPRRRVENPALNGVVLRKNFYLLAALASRRRAGSEPPPLALPRHPRIKATAVRFKSVDWAQSLVLSGVRHFNMNCSWNHTLRHGWRRGRGVAARSGARLPGLIRPGLRSGVAGGAGQFAEIDAHFGHGKFPSGFEL